MDSLQLEAISDTLVQEDNLNKIKIFEQKVKIYYD